MEPITRRLSLPPAEWLRQRHAARPCDTPDCTGELVVSTATYNADKGDMGIHWRIDRVCKICDEEESDHGFYQPSNSAKLYNDMPRIERDAGQTAEIDAIKLANPGKLDSVTIRKPKAK